MALPPPCLWELVFFDRKLRAGHLQWRPQYSRERREGRLATREESRRIHAIERRYFGRIGWRPVVRGRAPLAAPARSDSAPRGGRRQIWNDGICPIALPWWDFRP